MFTFAGNFLNTFCTPICSFLCLSNTNLCSAVDDDWFELSNSIYGGFDASTLVTVMNDLDGYSLMTLLLKVFESKTSTKYIDPVDNPTKGFSLGKYTIASPVIKSTGELNCSFEYNPVVRFFSSNWKLPDPVPRTSACGIPVDE